MYNVIQNYIITNGEQIKMRKKLVTIRIDEDLLKEIDKKAQDEERTRSSALNKLIKKGFENGEKAKNK